MRFINIIFWSALAPGEELLAATLEVWLQENKGRIVDGWKLCGKYDPEQKATVWWVERVEPDRRRADAN